MTNEVGLEKVKTVNYCFIIEYNYHHFTVLSSYI